MRVCDPKWVVRMVALSLWSCRIPIFYAISAASLAWNLVVLAEWLEVLGALGALLHSLLPLLLELCELLVYRPVLYILLNVILLRIVVKAGVLAPAKELKLQFEVEDGGFPGSPGMQSWAVLALLHVGGGGDAPPGELNFGMERPPTSPNDHSVDTTTEHKLQMNSSVFMKKRPSIVLIMEPPPLEADLHRNPPYPLAAERVTIQQPKRDSLFTIEPLEMACTERHAATLSMGAGAQTMMMNPHATLVDAEQAMNPHGTLVDAGGQPMDRDICMRIKAGPDSARKVGAQAAMAIAHDNPTEGRLIKRNSGGGRPDDYALNRQEFNQRVETFICKFKGNLTMQRRDSFNRLLGLVGGGGLRA